MDENIEAVSYAIPILVGVLTISPAWTLVKSFRRTKTTTDNALYQDKDGIATEESMAAYSTKTSLVFIFMSCLLGLAASFALAVFATVSRAYFHHIPSIWLLSVSWVSRFLLNLHDPNLQ